MLQLYLVKFKKLFFGIKRLFVERNVFWVALLVYILLLAKDPFGQRTLIPNLEPYPDTINYIVPARSLLAGGPFKIVREGRTLNPNVPPLYSITLLPFYAVNQDPRMFFFANLLFSALSFYLFYLVVRKISSSVIIMSICLFFYATNYYLYWYPQWAMAENLVLPIFLYATYLLTLRVETRNIFLAGLTCVAIYATKYAYLPFTIVYFFVYLTKILLEKRAKSLRPVIYLISSLLLFATLVLGYQYTIQNSNPFARYIQIFIGIFGKGDLNSNGGSAIVSSRGWFSSDFFKRNLPQYLNGVLGNRTRLLWETTPILPAYLLVMSWIGLIWACFKKKYRDISLPLLVLLIFPLIIISTFSTFDMRYIYHAIPTFLIGLAFFFVLLRTLIRKKSCGFILIVLAIFGYYFLGNAIRIKSQVVINIKYAETPWYYISVLRLNDYFTKETIVDDKKPVVISPMPPYYIDFYSNGNYELLPLARDQEFRLSKEEAWGKLDYSNLIALYKAYINDGRNLFVSTYGLGNEKNLHTAFKDLSNNFKLIEVYDGCYGQCRIYKLETKP